MAAPEREIRFARRMTDAEAMMGNVEKVRWLPSDFATVAGGRRRPTREEFARPYPPGGEGDAGGALQRPPRSTR